MEVVWQFLRVEPDGTLRYKHTIMDWVNTPSGSAIPRRWFEYVYKWWPCDAPGYYRFEVKGWNNENPW